MGATLGVPIIRIIEYIGMYIEVPCLGKLPGVS